MEAPFLGIPGIVRFIDVRTQLFDDSLAAALRDGIKQVVIIAAGYDTRAYRFSKPGVRFYEIDMPDASRKKQELVRKLLPAAKVRACEPAQCLTCIVGPRRCQRLLLKGCQFLLHSAGKHGPQQLESIRGMLQWTSHVSLHLAAT
jgi:hypothetical protein